jgi:hypothetical protein
MEKWGGEGKYLKAIKSCAANMGTVLVNDEEPLNVPKQLEPHFHWLDALLRSGLVRNQDGSLFQPSVVEEEVCPLETTIALSVFSAFHNTKYR